MKMFSDPLDPEDEVTYGGPVAVAVAVVIPPPPPPAKQHSTRGHARLSPSSASRWAVCTASPKLYEENWDRLPKDTSKYADEGTKAHEVAESFLMGRSVKSGGAITKDMVKHGKAYANFVKGLRDEFKDSLEQCKMVVEAEAPLWYSPDEEEKGHVDVYLSHPEIIRVIDYKYGAGVKVYAEDNHQMAIYAAAMIYEEGEPEGTMPVELYIYQPRCQKDKGELPYSVWRTTWDKLKLWVTSKVEIPAEVIQNPANAHLLKFVPSDKTCQWCRAKSFCTARTKFLLGDDIEALAEVLPVLVPSAMSDSSVAMILAKKGAIEKHLEEVWEYAKERAHAGKPIKGWRLGEGNGSRWWKSEKDAEVALHCIYGIDKDSIRPAKIISPAQAEDMLEELGEDPKELKSLIRSTPGQPVLVPQESSKKEYRPAVLDLPNLAVAKLFE